MAYSLTQLARCAHREAGMRKHVYPHQVGRGKMSQAKADDEIAMMEQIARLLDELAEKEKLI